MYCKCSGSEVSPVGGVYCKFKYINTRIAYLRNSSNNGPVVLEKNRDNTKYNIQSPFPFFFHPPRLKLVLYARIIAAFRPSALSHGTLPVHLLFYPNRQF